MPRTARVVIGSRYYHVLNRGTNRARIFHGASDYRTFLGLVREAQDRSCLEVLGGSLMPNHFHFLVRPLEDGALARWTHWLLTTHVRRHHWRHGTSGRLWQGPYKLFPVQEDGHLISVLRYIERNALRAGLVHRAELWPWGSLRWRTGGSSPVRLTPPPVELPGDWVDYVNRPQTAAELEALRLCVNRQRPYGGGGWVERTATELGLEQSLRPRGRPPADERIVGRGTGGKGDTPH